MYGLIKVPDNIVSINVNDIRWNEVMIVDPRDYTVSKWNSRLEDPERNIKGLEDSILYNGFITPLLADESKQIIDGSRRFRIALKHGLMIPVIHKKYSSETDKGIDSLICNMREDNTPVERAKIIDNLLKNGVSLNKISEALGVSKSQINNWLVQISLPEIIEPDAESLEIYKTLSERDRRQFNRIVKDLDLSPTEAKDELKYVSKLTSRELDEYLKDISTGLVVDKSSRVSVKDQKDQVELWNYYVLKKWSVKWKNKIRKRSWDKFKVLNALMNGFYLGLIDLTQEEYDDLNDSGVLDE